MQIYFTHSTTMQWNETERNETQIAARLNCISKPTIQKFHIANKIISTVSTYASPQHGYDYSPSSVKYSSPEPLS